MTGERLRDLIAGLLILAFGLTAIFVLIPKGIDEPASVQFAALSPSYWPRIICMILTAFGAVITLRALLRPGLPPDGEAAVTDSVDRTPLKTLVVLAGMMALYFALEPLGFPLACAIGLVLLMLLASERRPHIILPVAIGVPAALYLFFTEAASIPIPTGILEPVLVGG